MFTRKDGLFVYNPAYVATQLNGCICLTARFGGRKHRLLLTGYTYYPTIATLPAWLNRSDMEPRHCVSDEHYIPTLLAVHGLDEEVCKPTRLAAVRHAMAGGGRREKGAEIHLKTKPHMPHAVSVNAFQRIPT